MEQQTPSTLTLEEALAIFEQASHKAIYEPFNQPVSSGPLTLDQAFAQTNAMAKREPTELERSIGTQIFTSQSINAYLESYSGRFPDMAKALQVGALDILVFGTFLVVAGRLMGLDEASRSTGGR